MFFFQLTCIRTSEFENSVLVHLRKGLENGKHVLCEFPLALSLNVAKEFFDMAERKGEFKSNYNFLKFLRSSKNRQVKQTVKVFDFLGHLSYSGDMLCLLPFRRPSSVVRRA